MPHHRSRQCHALALAAGELARLALKEALDAEHPQQPPRDRAPSNLILTGRYILQPEILDLLGTQERGTGGEIQLTDAMIQLARTQPFYGLEFEGRSFDCGSKIGFLAANVSYALARADIAPGFRAEIKKILGELNGG